MTAREAYTKRLIDLIKAGSDVAKAVDECLAGMSRAQLLEVARPVLIWQATRASRKLTRVKERSVFANLVRATDRPETKPAAPAPASPLLTGVDGLRGLLRDTMAMPDGRRIRWGEATAEDHLRRAKWLRQGAQANLRTAQQHEHSAELLQRAGLRESEHQLALFMRRTMRRAAPELAAWQKETVGIGEHLLARLLGQIGHPVVTIVHAWEGTGSDRHLVVVGIKRRRVSDLWSYCGHGDPERRPRRGMSAEDALALGNPRAKMLVHLLAAACIKLVGAPAKARTDTTEVAPARRPSPYRAVYDERRMDTADRTHAAPCVRCGPAGSPALEGSLWSPGHQHADALRVVGKEILRDLWIAASGGPT